MTTATHTPIPWKTKNGNEIRSQSGTCVAILISSGAKEDNSKIDEANAAHIVRCVNERDTYIALHDAVQRFIDDWIEPDSDQWNESFEIRAILEQIASARGEVA